VNAARADESFTTIAEVGMICSAPAGDVEATAVDLEADMPPGLDDDAVES
jgi:hypothetical protein